MSKRRISWKENRVLSIETRKGVFVLAQMLRDPFLRFYNAFRTGEESWEKIDCSELDILFTKAIITKNYLAQSDCTILKDATADPERRDSTKWIKEYPGFRKVSVWPDSENETTVTMIGSSPGGMLVERDLYKVGLYDHPSGIFDRILDENISPDSDEIIKNSETMGIGIFPILNERLYLCYKSKSNVDPYKDLLFDKEISLESKLAIELMSGNKDRKKQIIEEYFNCV